MEKKLINNNKYTIGLFLNCLTGGYVEIIIDKIIETCEEADVNLVIIPGDNPALEKYSFQHNLLYDLTPNEYLDGIIVISRVLGDPATVEHLLSKALALPAVVIGEEIQSAVSTISVDNVAGMVEGLEHFIEFHKYRKIAFIKGLEGNDEAEERFQIYKDTLKKHNIAYDENLVYYGDFSPSGGKKAVIDFLDRRSLSVEDIDAVFASNDDMATGAVSEFESRGINVPVDIPVAGFDNLNAMGALGIPLASVGQPLKEMSACAVLTLIDYLNGKKVKKKQTFSTKYIKRSSCGCLLNNRDIARVKDEKYYQDMLAGEDVSQVLQKIAESDGEPLPFSWQEFLDLIVEMRDTALDELVCNRFVIDFTRLIVKSHITYNDSQKILQMLKTSSEYIKSEVADFYENRWYELFFIEADTIVDNMSSEISGTARTNAAANSNALIERGLQQMVSLSSIEELANSLFHELPKIEINNCYISLYKNYHTIKNNLNATLSLPSQASMVLGYADKKRVYSDSEYFDAKMLVPHDVILGNNRLTLVLETLYFEENTYGFILFEMSRMYRGYIYETVRRQICTAIRFMVNIEEKRAANQVLEKSNRKLEELDKIKNDFIANITHDFRMPLSVVLNTVDITMRYTNLADQSTVLDRLRTVYTASKKLKFSIDRLLDLAKMDSGGLKLKIRELKLKKFLFHLFDFYSSSVSASGIEFFSSLPQSEIENFYTDPERLEEILSNIVSNAIKYVDVDYGKIVISLHDYSDSIQLEIKDNGIGIEKDKLGTVFNRFEQVDTESNRTHKGTGIGLAFAKQLTNLLKGNITAYSDGPGTGATFTLIFPKGKDVFDRVNYDFVGEEFEYNPNDLKSQLQDEISDKKNWSGTGRIEVDIKELNLENEFNPNKGLILIVDDNKHIREIISVYLEHAGYRNFIFADNGIVAIEAVYQYKPDFIICDYNMPRMRGDQFHDEIATNPDFKKVPFIFVTALTDRSTLIDRKRRGAIAYLSKPVEEDELISTVNVHMKSYMDFKQMFMRATVDELTGLNNRRTLMELLLVQVSIREKRNLSVIFLDIDYFKSINDTYGHHVGDIVLKAFGQLIESHKRPYDIAGRYGGEEFVIVLPGASAAAAKKAAEKFRTLIESMDLFDDTEKIKLTASFGVVSLLDNDHYFAEKCGIDSLDYLFVITNPNAVDWDEYQGRKRILRDEMLKAADAALYQAKSTICTTCGFLSDKEQSFEAGQCPECGGTDLQQGRNRVSVFNSGQ